MAEQVSAWSRRDEELCAEGVALANLPTLLMVLVQLTGELRWLEDPYRPRRAWGMGDNDTGRLPEPVQAEIREAALEAILAWRRGRPAAIPEPSPELRVQMLSCAMGEEIPKEYAPLIAAQLGFETLGSDEEIAVPDGFSVLIIGAGVSGICAAVNLQRAGIPFTILEKNATVGGTWLENRYPGAGVDTPNHLYSFSFATYDWSMYFALRDELWSYLEHVTDKFELGPRIRFETEVESALYHAWYRMRLGWTFSDRMHPALQKDPSWPHPDRSLNAINDAQRTYFTQYIESELGDRTELLDLVVPPYPPFGKRMLLDNGWYRMLRNDRVLLVADPVVEIGPDRIITENGNEHPADVLVLATGFDVLRFLTSFEARGRSGRSLREVWDDDDARAFLGLAIPDFPNFFCLYGPNTQPGAGGSLIFVIEMQMRYIMDMLRKMAVQKIGAVECRQDVHDVYNERIDRAHENMVWTHKGMQTYYRNARGRVPVNYPYRNVDLFQVTSRADLADFIAEPRRS